MTQRHDILIASRKTFTREGYSDLHILVVAPQFDKAKPIFGADVGVHLGWSLRWARIGEDGIDVLKHPDETGGLETIHPTADDALASLEAFLGSEEFRRFLFRPT